MVLNVEKYEMLVIGNNLLYDFFFFEFRVNLFIGIYNVSE